MNSEEQRINAWNFQRRCDNGYLLKDKYDKIQLRQIMEDHKNEFKRVEKILKITYMNTGENKLIGAIGDIKRFVYFEKPELLLRHYTNGEDERRNKIVEVGREEVIRIYPGPQVGSTIQYFLGCLALTEKNRNIDIELIVLTQFKELLTYLADGRIRIGSKSEELDSDIYVHPWFKLKGRLRSATEVYNENANNNVIDLLNRRANLFFEKKNMVLPKEIEELTKKGKYIYVTAGVQEITREGYLVNYFTGREEPFYDYMRRIKPEIVARLIKSLSERSPVVYNVWGLNIDDKNSINLYNVAQKEKWSSTEFFEYTCYLTMNASASITNATGGIIPGLCGKNI